MQPRILIIEDNPENLELITYLLHQYGYQTLVATDGLAGLNLATKEKPDIILCDIQLPKLNGYEIVKKIKANPLIAKIPIVAVTAYSMLDDKEKILAAGFDGYLSKPIDPEIFVNQIEKFLPQIQAGKDASLNDDLPVKENRISKTNAAKQGTVLIVDDSVENRELSRALLNSLDFDSIFASSVQQSLKILAQTRPDFILSDMHIPGLGGLDFLRIIKKDPSLQSIPFVILSSSSPSKAQKKECLELGALEIILRPIEPELFLKMIKKIWTSVNTSQPKLEK